MGETAPDDLELTDSDLDPPGAAGPGRRPPPRWRLDDDGDPLIVLDTAVPAGAPRLAVAFASAAGRGDLLREFVAEANAAGALRDERDAVCRAAVAPAERAGDRVTAWRAVAMKMGADGLGYPWTVTAPTHEEAVAWLRYKALLPPRADAPPDGQAAPDARGDAENPYPLRRDLAEARESARRAEEALHELLVVLRRKAVRVRESPGHALMSFVFVLQHASVLAGETDDDAPLREAAGEILRAARDVHEILSGPKAGPAPPAVESVVEAARPWYVRWFR